MCIRDRYCRKCLTEIQPDHLRYQIFTDHLINSNSPFIYNWPNQEYQIDNIIQFVKQIHPQQQNFEYITKAFTEIKEQFLKTLTKIENDVIKYIQTKKNFQVDFINKIKSELEQIFSLDKLTQILNQAETQKSQDTLQLDIKQFFDDQQRFEQAKQLKVLFEQNCKAQNQLTLNTDLLYTVMSKLCETMQQLPIEIIQGKSLDLSFEPSKYMNSSQRLIISDEKLIFNQSLKEPQDTYAISSVFDRNEEVYIKMKLKGNLKNVWIGVMAEENKDDTIYWYKTGNQIYLNSDQLISKDQFICQGKFFKDVLQDGVILIVQINIQKGKFQFFDEAKTSIYKSKKKSFEDNKQWRFAILSHFESCIELIEIRKM
eukprot:TRINITY_DN12086_c0_g1_i2.p1 TRINITY_DN12086_c0_g1~~TRINITY_DN12086_c0_g1_i2.p1  ORF type:complete len:371 (+),score=69.54 TRINITY_DN12086_c0_g1_i2:145-1257(+)